MMPTGAPTLYTPMAMPRRAGAKMSESSENAAGELPASAAPTSTRIASSIAKPVASPQAAVARLQAMSIAANSRTRRERSTTGPMSRLVTANDAP